MEKTIKKVNRIPPKHNTKVEVPKLNKDHIKKNYSVPKIKSKFDFFIHYYLFII